MLFLNHNISSHLGKLFLRQVPGANLFSLISRIRITETLFRVAVFNLTVCKLFNAVPCMNQENNYVNDYI